MRELDDRTLAVLDELIAALELRDAGDPDVPSWEADARIRRLEAELVGRFRLIERPPRSGSSTPGREPALLGVL
jgi:hypothetical protein